MPFRTPLILLLTGIVLAGCDPAAVPDRAPGDAERDDDATPVAAYERRYLLLGGDEDAPFGLVFDFDILDLGTVVQHAAFGWLGRGTVLEAFLEERWELAPLRDAWRLVPHGPFRLTVDDGGEPSALIYRAADRELRLLPGAELYAWNPRGEVQVRLRQASVLLGTERYAARLIETLTRIDLDGGPPREGPDVAEEIFLSDGRGLFLLSMRSASGSFAWIAGDGIDRCWREVSVDWVHQQAYESARRTVPTGWLLESPGGSLRAEVQSAARDLLVIPDGSAQPAIRGMHLVRGWIELDGNRRPVYGLVRHAQQ